MASGGECVLRHAPRFRITIQELWPDNAEAEINSMVRSPMRSNGGETCHLKRKHSEQKLVA